MKGVTDYQVECLRLLSEGGPDGQLDFDQLLEKLSWEPSKSSAQFTIRALCTKGLISKLPHELRRGRKRVLYGLTPAGAAVLDPRALAAPPEPGVKTEPGAEAPPGHRPKKKKVAVAAEAPPAAAKFELPDPGLEMDELEQLLTEGGESALTPHCEEIID